MLTLKAAKYGAIAGLATTGITYFSMGWLHVVETVEEQFSNTRAAVIQGLAEDLGYEKPKPQMEELDKFALVEREALRHKLNPSLARALMKVESNNNRFAVSHVGAIGAMQVMPFNAKRCGLPHYGELFDEEKNIQCGVRILAEDMKAAKNNPQIALQVYNGGPKCVNKCKESIEHARKVLTEMATDIRG